MAKRLDLKNDELRAANSDVTTSYLAELLGITQPAASKLYQARTIVQNGKRGRYDLHDAIPRYIQSIRSSGTAEASARLKVAQREKLEIENRRVRRQTVAITDAAEVFRQACISWRAGASAIPRRLATELGNTKSAVACREILANEIGDLFTEVEKPFSEYFGESWNSPRAIEPRTNGAAKPAKKNARRLGGRKPNPSARKRRTRKVAK